MSTTIRATFDGEVFRPIDPIPLAPNTEVTITIETPGEAEPRPASFLDTALSLNLEGPTDLSERLHDYLHGDKVPGDG
jgi:hypothetical protein